MIKRLALVALLSVASLATAFAQSWPNVPIIGGASYCQSTVNGACVSTIPAGPALSGSETIPADTNASQGQSPQTAKLNIQTIGGGTYQYAAPLTGATITATNLNNQLIIEPAGTIAALTVVFPAATTLLDGQSLGLCGTQIVTTLTMTAGSGTTISNPATAMLVPVATGDGSCMRWRYRLSNTTWYRTQ